MKKDSLGDRMKGYEKVSQSSTLRRTPVIIRVDGKAFHTFTRKLLTTEVDQSLNTSPFSELMHKLMISTTQALCENVQNCVIGYTQSDEISLLLTDWGKHETQQWFGGKLQKMVSISAAIASATFTSEWNKETGGNDRLMFDARVFNIPHSDVDNYFIWRQKDATRNSINMLGQYYCSHAELQGLNTSAVQDKLVSEHNTNWNDLKPWMKRGSCVEHNNDIVRGAWRENTQIPVFTQQRDYITQYLQPEE